MSRLPAHVVLGVLAWLSFVTPIRSVSPARPAVSLPAAPTQDAAAAAKASRPALAEEDIEKFLLEARVIKTRGAGKGITGSIRATLTDGTITHDAQIQTIDESKKEFRSAQGVEFNFRDSWMYNVAAYRINRLLGMDLAPVSVSRRWKSSPAAFTWWVDDVMMDEEERYKRKVAPPDVEGWNQQMQLLRLFDQLIANVDRNLGNLLITSDWRIWAIDHTRAFRTQAVLKSPGNIRRCERQVFEKLKQLDRTSLRSAAGDYLQTWEIESVLKRRDAIVDLIEKQGAAGLYDRPK